MENISSVFQRQKRKKTHGETEFHNSIQDWVFTTVYRLQKSAWKNDWKSNSFSDLPDTSITYFWEIGK